MEGMMTLVVWGLGIIILGAIAWLLWTNRESFRRRERINAEVVRTSTPDLNSEDVVASQLPEDEWLKLGREMLERGERRLAIRAFYLATLAHLRFRELISVARHKSNRDYLRELRRRARSREEMLVAFDENVSLFEGVWYGSHETTGEVVGRFSGNLERIKAA